MEPRAASRSTASPASISTCGCRRRTSCCRNAKLGRTAIAANLRGGKLIVTIGEAQAFGGVIKGSLALANSNAGVEVKSQTAVHRRRSRKLPGPDVRAAPARRQGQYVAVTSKAPATACWP